MSDNIQFLGAPRVYGERSPGVQKALDRVAKDLEDHRNVNEKYKWWTTEDIKADLDTKRSNLVFGFINVSGDFNKATGVRSLNFFNGQEVWMIGKKRWDPRGAVGAQHYLNVKHAELDQLASVIDDFRARGYRVLAIEQDDRAVNMMDLHWYEKTVCLFGEEGDGLSKDVLDLVDDIVYIPGGGSVRSLNVGVTSGIVAYEYSKRWTR